MRFCIYKKIEILISVAFFGVLGAIICSSPNFLLSNIFYSSLTGYAIIKGALAIFGVLLKKEPKSVKQYGSIIFGGLMLLLGLHLIVFQHYLVHLTPILLSGLLFLEGVAHFALYSSNLRGILSLMAIFIMLGSLFILIFTFGFGVNGIKGLAQVSGATMLISCVYEGIFYLTRYKLKKPDRKEVE